MFAASWCTFRDRWQVFVGAIITVCVGVGLVQASLLTLVASATAKIPRDLPQKESWELHDGYETATALLGISLGLSAFIAIFIVSSTFAFTVDQRRRDLALLRLTGAGRGQIRVLLFGEALLLGLIGSVLGILLGLPLTHLEISMLDEFDFVPPGFSAQWRSWIVFVSVGVGVGVAVLGVLASSTRAARVRPLEALRETGREAPVMTVSRWILGVLFLAGGIAMMILVPLVGAEGAIAMSMLLSMVLVVAFAALAPLMAPLVRWPLALVFRGALGQLAYANLRAGVRRSVSTAAPIMVFVAFVAGMASAQAALTEAGRQEITHTLRGDLVVTADRSITTELTAVEGVSTVSPEVPLTFELSLDEGDGEIRREIEDGLAVDPASYARTHRLDVRAGDLADLRGATVAVSPDGDPDHHWEVGETLRVALPGGPDRLRIVAVLPTTLTGPWFLLPADLAQGQTTWQYTVDVADGADTSTVARRLTGLGTTVTRDKWIREYASKAQNENVKITIALLGLAMLYTIMAMINAVVVSASERGHEFATAQVTGLTRAQVVRAALWESMAVALIGLVLGGAAAGCTVVGMAMTTKNIIGDAVVRVSLPLLVALALGAALIVGVTSVLTTLAATRSPAIRSVTARE